MTETPADDTFEPSGLPEPIFDEGGESDGFTVRPAPISADALLGQLIDDTPGASRRPPQDRMVHLIEDSLAQGRNVAVQAGTGTGKSYGYLVGALAGGNRVAVSTSTKQLGEQLASKDVPAVAAASAKLGRELRIALLKGRNNYLCLARKDEIDRLGQQDTLAGTEPLNETGEQVTQIMEWAATTETGDRTEAPVVSDRVWNQFSTDSASCPGAKVCPMGEVCFAEVAKRRARDADVAVINHTLMARYLGLAADGAPTLLDHFDVLAIDEAHDLGEDLSRAWSDELDPRRIERALNAAKRLDDAESDIALALASTGSLRDILAAMPDGELTAMPEAAVDLMTSLVATLRSLARKANEKAKDSVEVSWQMLAGRLSNTVDEINATMGTSEATVTWLERDRDSSPVLKRAPLSVAGRFAAATEDHEVVLASATLTVGGSFTPILENLGIDADSEDVGTPFNYDKQVMLYVPSADFPAPVGSAEDRAAHTQAVQDTLCSLIEAAGGRTLGLFTTTRAAREAAQVVRTRFPHLNVLVHGEAPMGRLVDEFRDDETSVLLGTRGLWQGLDVQGPSLSVVVVDKAPFPMFNDPLMNARKRAVDEAGGRGFDQVMVTSAAIALAQGAGRLIRTATDRGVIAVLDPRLRTKYYGRTLMRSLPRVRAWDDLETVTAALKRLVDGTTREEVAA